MQAGTRCGATGLKKYCSTCWNCGYNRKASGRVGTNFVPALPDTFHSFGLMIRSYSRTYFFWMTLSMW